MMYHKSILGSAAGRGVKLLTPRERPVIVAKGQRWDLESLIESVTIFQRKWC